MNFSLGRKVSNEYLLFLSITPRNSALLMTLLYLTHYLHHFGQIACQMILPLKTPIMISQSQRQQWLKCLNIDKFVRHLPGILNESHFCYWLMVL